MIRKRMLYSGLVARGGYVPDQDTWREVGQSAGYTWHRDLAGFFGGQVPSAVLNPDGSRSLTPAGWARARQLGITRRGAG